MEHITVFLEEGIEYLNIKEDGIYVDATLGGAGHSSLILKHLTKGHLYSFDQDEFAINKSREKLSKIGNNFTIIKSNFVNLEEELLKYNVTHIDGIIYDLGVSSFQFDTPERGFSYRFDAPLDMRMDKDNPISAKVIVNEYSFEEIKNILFRYGDEKNAKQIARKIEEYRKEKPIETTFELVDIIKKAMTMKELSKKGHPAKKSFQALRIAVNDELRVFEKSLGSALKLLNKDGRCVCITFHSLEDRICKTMFKEASSVNIPKNLPVTNIEAPFSLVTSHALNPSEEELENNNRAHSAHLRCIKKN